MGMGELGWCGFVFGGEGGCLSEFWTSGVVYMMILTTSKTILCLTQFGQKAD